MPTRPSIFTSCRNFLDNRFEITRKGSSLKIEIIAGMTTFITMVYIIFVNPAILGVTGMDPEAVFVMTCLISAFASIMMGLFANLPIGLAPGMGLNAFFAYSVVKGMGYSWQVGMGTLFWGSLLFLILCLFRVRHWLIANIPESIRLGITTGVGLFIMMMGLQNMKLIVGNPDTLVAIGHLGSHSVLLGSLGFFIILVLAARNIHVSILLSILVVTLLAWALGDVSYHGMVSMPPSVNTIVGHIDLKDSFSLATTGVIFSVLLVTLFDSSGTLLGLIDRAGLADEKGNVPKMQQALVVDGISSTLGGLFGTSSVLAYVESSSGISVGGKTGLTAIVIGLLFLLVVFFSPLISMVPTYATAGALVYVGILMGANFRKFNWDELTDAAPAFITAIMMPLSYSITEGIALGFVSYVILKLFTGRYREISICSLIIALLFMLKFIFVDAH